MSLSTVSFMCIYFPILLVVYYNPFFKSRRFRNVILLLTSLGLYAFSEPVYIFLLLLSVLFNYYLVKIENKTNQYLWGYVAIVLDVSVLLFFKYVNQILYLGQRGDNIISIIAFPIGLSYFTFREISYIAESRKDGRYRSVGIVETALFISNFTTITAGPLGFYDSEIEQVMHRQENKREIYAGIQRCAVGLIKKVIIADSLRNLVNICFSLTNISIGMAWIGAIAYTLQIYFDFSGYTDMALGIGRTFGFSLLENFSMPYTARSVSEFWKRWHMSLTMWFTKYIYIPLGGSRVNSKVRHIFNLWCVWLCTGIWHGSNWTFILWGMIYFVVQTIEKYTHIEQKLNKVHLGHLYTMVIVILCWVIFRSDSVSDAFAYIKIMFGIEYTGGGLIDRGEIGIIKYYIIPIIFGILLSSSLVNKFNELKKANVMVNVIQYIGVFFLFVVTIVIMIGRGYTAPLYAGF